MASESNKKRLIEYLKRNLKKGYTLDSLKWGLVRQGYSRAIIDLAIKEMNEEMSIQAPVLKEKPTIKYEVLDAYDNPIEVKKPFWKRVLEG